MFVNTKRGLAARESTFQTSEEVIAAACARARQRAHTTSALLLDKAGWIHPLNARVHEQKRALLEPEAFRLLNGNHHHFDQLLLGLVRRQVDAVEAGVTPGQQLLVIQPFDAELHRPVRANQVAKPADREPRGACDKLEQPCPLLVRERVDQLPEPLDLLRIGEVIPVDGVLLPVVHVELSNPLEQDVQLSLVKYLEVLERQNLVKPGKEGGHLLLAAFCDPGPARQLHKLLPVLHRHQLRRPTGHQFHFLHLTKLVVRSFKRLLHAFQLFGGGREEPLERVVRHLVKVAQIVHAERLLQHLLVEGHGEAAVDQFVVEDGEGDEAADESEQPGVLRVDPRIRVDRQRV
eukprot:m.437186 g.437186  ORF g.437186 m.437186 type:complete len:348 (+) comp18078_c0_seq1:51-1094(+)